MKPPPWEAIPPEMVEAAHEAETITGSQYGRYRQIIAAVWPLIAAAERERLAQLLDAKGDEIGRDTFDSVSVPIGAAAFHDAADFIRQENQP